MDPDFKKQCRVWGWFMAVVAALAALLLIGCCRSPTDIEAPWAVYDPPIEYAAWWAEAKECAGPIIRWYDQRDYTDIEWRVVYTPKGFECGFDFKCAGLTTTNRVVYIGQKWVLDRRVIVHEMLHVLTTQNHFDGEAFVLCNTPFPGGRP
jgi:hypothetical protein